MPSEYDQEAEMYRRNALKFLTTEIYNNENENVLQHSARLAATGKAIIGQ